MVAVDGDSFDEGIAQYSTTTRLLYEYLEEEDARVWAENRRAQLNVCFEWIAGLLFLIGTYGDKLWMLRFGGGFC